MHALPPLLPAHLAPPFQELEAFRARSESDIVTWLTWRALEAAPGAHCLLLVPSQPGAGSPDDVSAWQQPAPLMQPGGLLKVGDCLPDCGC